MNKLTTAIHNYSLKHLKGRATLRFFGKKVTIYGANAMWFAVQFHTRRWGWIVFRPPTWNPHFKWKFYASANGTPGCATFAIGPGISNEEKRRAWIRRQMLGHNFDVDAYDYVSILEIDYAGPLPANEVQP